MPSPSPAPALVASAMPRTAYALATEPMSAQPRLEQSLHADVCILGAGLTGLSTAIELAQAGLSVIVLEAKRIAWGASGRNGGQAIFGFGCDQSKIQAMVGIEQSRRLFNWSLEGIQLIHERRARFNIDCDWRDGHAHVPIKPRQVSELQSWQADLSANYGYDLQWWDASALRAQLASERAIPWCLVRSAQRPSQSTQIHARTRPRGAVTWRAHLRGLCGA